nr:ATP-dependent DNA helicase Q-like SIM isoform X1 [Ziziphus jujuba var. spinosa]
MDGQGSSSDQVIAKLIEMGFTNSSVKDAVQAVGSSFDDALEYILNSCDRNSERATSSSRCSPSNGKAPRKRALSSLSALSQMRQSSIVEHFQSSRRPKHSKMDAIGDASVSVGKVFPVHVEQCKQPLSYESYHNRNSTETFTFNCPQEVDLGSDWEQKVNGILQKHFGYSSLKKFQREALTAWLAHQDCLVLAATGAGKSLCFQIPAILTGKVVVVISPLISLMHDQCLKLAKYGVSACFLGSGQPDSTVENKAMKGMYSIIYICPETVIRLIKPLQHLTESRGIALFAIDEVHCVSKWGHDFRPYYRRLSVLRENFTASSLKFLKSDIPIMALTATATIQVREDIIKSLAMSNETKVVLTSFFRENLRFSVKHSRTSSRSSYQKDFQELIDIYVTKIKTGEKKQHIFSQELGNASDTSVNTSISEQDDISETDLSDIEDGYYDIDDEVNSTKKNGSRATKGKEMSVEYLENEVDIYQSVDDWDVACGEFCAQSPLRDRDISGFKTVGSPKGLEERLKCIQETSDQGLTIIYVPTRKETLSITKYLCGCGVKAAAYNAALPKSHLRQVHKEFHENTLEVVVATIAFGMGIDKLNVRRIIHYGWPQSLEAYYQEAGRAGRDGKLADCVLIANLTKVPSLLPNKRSEEQIKQAYKMLSDCFRYGMNSSSCRAKTLVEYFGEEFTYQKCHLCDVCVNGPPEKQDLSEEADIFMQVIAAYYGKRTPLDGSYYDVISSDNKQQSFMEKPNLRTFVSKIREQSQKFMATDLLWWQGLARILESKGFIREGDDKTHVQLKFPELTELGMEVLQSKEDETFYVYPEADMLLSESQSQSKPFSSFSDWGKGWADPEIRRQRLESMRFNRNPVKPTGSRWPRKSGKQRKRKSSKHNADMRTVRGRIAAKISKKKY